MCVWVRSIVGQLSGGSRVAPFNLSLLEIRSLGLQEYLDGEGSYGS